MSRIGFYHAGAVLALAVIAMFIKACTPSTAFTSVQTVEGYAGAVNSSFHIGSNGEASLTFPIEVIPGTRGMQPSLSLAYNSKGSNGLAGMGMRLSGISVIKRIGATPVQDGFWGSVNYDSNDRFALDGQRLMIVQGDYGDADSEYHTQVETWQKVQAVGQCGNGPCGFKVWSKNGSLHEYGLTDDSRIEAQGEDAVRVWALNRSTDLNGNYITYTYTEVDGSYYPKTIAYSGNDAGGLTPGRFVDFSYETRTDSFPQFEGGAPFRYAKRLSGITTRLGNQPVLQYFLDYTYETVTGRSMVTAVSECDSVGVCLPATTLGWTEGDTTLLSSARALTASIASSNIYSTDINADGLTDVVSVQTGNSKAFEVETWLSNGVELVQSGDFQVSDMERNGSAVPADVNGDGRVDLLYMLTSSTDPLKVYTFLSDGSTLVLTDTFEAPASWPTTNASVTVLDVNGDARSDIVSTQLPNYAEKDLTVSTFLSNGSSFTADTVQTIAVTDPEEGGNLFSVDVNADNRGDLAWVSSGSGTDSLLVRMLMSQGRYYTTSAPQAFAFFGGSGGTVMTLDVNGDRFTDLVYAGSTFNDTLKLSTFLSNGENFENGIEQVGAQAHSTDRCNLVPTDVNGDGMQDLVVANTDASASYLLSCYLSVGDGFAAPQNLPQTSGTSGGIPMPVDLNGDAMYDLLYAVSEQGFDDYYYNFSIYEATSTYPSLLETIENNVGGLVEIHYRPLTDSSVYSRPPLADTAFLPASSQVNTINGATYGIGTSSVSIGGTSYPIVDVELPVYAVSEYVKSCNQGDAYGYSFFYSGAKMNRGGYGWLGFESKSNYDTSLNTIGVTYYEQEFPLIGMIDHTTMYRMSDSAELNRVQQTYLIDYPIPGDTLIAQPLMTQVEKELYTYGTWNLNLQMSYAYDTFANPILVRNIGDLSDPKPVYTISEYDNDLSRWQLGYVTSSKQSRDSTGLFTEQLYSWQLTEYDTSRNVVRSRSYNNQLSDFVNTNYRYDVFGNDTAMISASNDTTITRFDSLYATYQVETISPPNQWGNQLVNTITYDYGFGEAASHTDPNGITNYYGYDGLGRLSYVRGPDPQGDTTTLMTRTWEMTGDSGFYMESRTRLEWARDEFPWTRSYTDGLLRNYQTTSVGATFDQVRVTDRSYDSKQRVIRESLPYWEGSDTIVYATTTYDPYGRVIESVAPKDNQDSIVTVYDFPTRQQVVITEAYGTVDSAQVTILQTYYSSQPQMTVRVNELGDSTYFDFDWLGRSISSTDPMGNTSTVTYNTMGRKQTASTPSMGATQYFYYDSLMYNLQVNANSDTVLTRFDGLGRRILKQYSPTDSIVYQYDNPASANGQGQLTGVFLPSGNTYQSTYDDYGNRDSIVFSLGGTDYITTQEFDPNHRVDAMTWPDGSVMKYAYQLDGHIDSVLVDDASDGQSGNFTAYARYENYSALGQATQIQYGNGVVGDFDYFNSGLMDSLQLTGPTGDNLLEQVFNRNYRNQLTAVQNLDSASAAWSQVFDYDAAGELTTANGGYGAYNYSYDAAGNMTSKQGTSWSYSGFQVTSGMVGQDTVSSLKYDAMGNLSSKASNGTSYSYQYNQLQQLTGLSRNDSAVYRFAYDHEGRRISRADSVDQSIIYYVSPTFEVTVDLAAGDTLYTKYVKGASGLIASITSAAEDVELLEAGSADEGGFWPVSWPAFPPAWWLALCCAICGLLYGFGLLRQRFAERSWTVPGMLKDALATALFASILAMAVGVPQSARAAAMSELADEPEVGILYFFQDYVASTQLTTDEQGSVSARVFYEPYGAIAELEGSDSFRPKFGGKELDAASELYYFNARYYDPETGRFITSDSQLGGSLNQSYVFNQYAFTLNNPVNHTDPSGHNVFSWFHHHSKQLGAIAISTLEIAAGVTLTVVSGGALSMVGEGLINAGIEGIVYTSTHFNNFQWSQFGIAQGIGFATGVAFAGAFSLIGFGAERAASRGASEAAERGASEASERGAAAAGEEAGERASSASEDASASEAKTGCFVAGTLVATKTGMRPIESIEPGDEVWSYNEATGKRELNGVVQLFRPVADGLIVIEAGGETIEATEEHPFWVDGRWVPAAELKVGDVLSLLSGGSVVVEDVAVKGFKGTVYNFEVARVHTYYVSEQEVLVHNACKRSARIAELETKALGKRARTEPERFSELDFSPKPRRVKFRTPDGSGYRTGLHFPEGTYITKVKIAYQGSREADYRAAEAATGRTHVPNETVWHHYHDYDAGTNTGTMYLVRTTDHAPSHSGGVYQAREAGPPAGWQKSWYVLLREEDEPLPWAAIVWFSESIRREQRQAA